MSENNDDTLAMLAQKQDDLWEQDTARFSDGSLEVPFAYIMWAYRTGVDVSKVSLGSDTSVWPYEIVQASVKLGGNATAVMTVGMGTVVRFSQTEKDAQSLLSISNGVPPSELPGARLHLVSHMKTVVSGLPERIVGAAVTDTQGLEDTVDSGFTSCVVQV